jgi:hypothetical protein
VGQVDPDQDAALRRLRAAFGFVEVLEIIDPEPIRTRATTRRRRPTRTAARRDCEPAAN